MEIIRENTGEMSAQLRIKVTREDYLEKIEKELKKLQKDMVLPGFRKGKVPMGHVKRLYGQAVIVEEVNKMLSDALQKYIDENHLDLLGYPLPGKDSKPFDPELQSEHEFLFDIGLAPSFELNMDAVSGITYTRLIPGNEDIEKEIENYRHQFAKVEPQEVSNENSIFEGTLVEVNENGEPIEGGFSIQRSFHLHSDLISAEDKTAFVGVKAGDKVPFKVSSAAALAKYAEISEEKADSLKDKLYFAIEDIKQEILPDINEEFFNQVFPNQNLQTEEDFRKEVAQRIQLGWIQRIADQRFLNDVADRFIETHDIPLPDEFLKRWIVANSEGKITQEDVEKEYDKKYAKGIRWELIESRIREKANLEITHDDLRDRMKRDLIENYFGFLRNSAEGDARLDALAADMLKSEEQSRKVYDEVSEEKLIAFLRDNLQVNIVEQSINEYFDSLKKQPSSKGEEQTENMENAEQ
ncbi:MAG: trigger factor [Bacteroidales bacterium]|jgi:trigger factor|nr:trigger factor [Bacteroidales bacterium]MDN5330454.1 trigger factor [Bacteroidales bacterium]NLH53089.1 trigger factor [Bacteroidales bacterium]NPV36820.1 trigger factor [Bacteroidales bacterium]